MAANTVWVSIGTDHDTGAFAVASIRLVSYCLIRLAPRHQYQHFALTGG